MLPSVASNLCLSINVSCKGLGRIDICVLCFSPIF
jgi:hypothetical protein